jgi:hypothetical protein
MRLCDIHATIDTMPESRTYQKTTVGTAFVSLAHRLSMIPPEMISTHNSLVVPLNLADGWRI